MIHNLFIYSFSFAGLWCFVGAYFGLQFCLSSPGIILFYCYEHIGWLVGFSLVVWFFLLLSFPFHSSLDYVCLSIFLIRFLTENYMIRKLCIEILFLYAASCTASHHLVGWRTFSLRTCYVYFDRAVVSFCLTLCRWLSAPCTNLMLCLLQVFVLELPCVWMQRFGNPNM